MDRTEESEAFEQSEQSALPASPGPEFIGFSEPLRRMMFEAFARDYLVEWLELLRVHDIGIEDGFDGNEILKEVEIYRAYSVT